MTTSQEMKQAVALNRFGLGARRDEPLPQEPKRWLRAQFETYQPRPADWQGQPGSAAQVVSYVDYLRELRQADAGGEQAAREKLRIQIQGVYRSAVAARTATALGSPAPFAERLVHFWANHFAVSIDKPPVGTLAGAFEAEAIRPHIFGRFEDLLLAVEHHPAMLLYLDQARSIGPDSFAGRRSARMNPDRQRGLNENLAREILELHTLGVRGGYRQEDVTELARALTGWSVGGLPGLPPAATGEFAFQPRLHEPGARMLMGRRYDQPDEAQALAILRDLAVHPATATYLATKLARHFVADLPPPALVERLAAAFLRTRGDLASVYEVLIDAPEAWQAGPSKFKTPWEWTVSSLRGLGSSDLGQPVALVVGQLGQVVWRPGSPAGFDDIAESWAAPDALMRRVEAAQRIAARAGATLDARALAPQLLPGGLSENTATAIARAESPATALALLLASPEFLRR